jgi:hypothetical protein
MDTGMTGQHAHPEDEALTVHHLMARLLAEIRDELDAERKPYGRHARVHPLTQRQSSST